jgi:hypothetical protein
MPDPSSVHGTRARDADRSSRLLLRQERYRTGLRRGPAGTDVRGLVRERLANANANDIGCELNANNHLALAKSLWYSLALDDSY